VLLIDLKKTFDAIDHEIILRHLANYGVDPNALRFFASYLCNRSQKCSVNEALSNLRGSPGKYILGPLFFLIYVNDLPNCLDISCAKMYSDDTNITVPGALFPNSDKQPILNLPIFIAGQEPGGEELPYGMDEDARRKF